jgi:hypothetical protein
MKRNKSILIIDIDSKVPNFALAKVGKFYSDKGYSIYKNLFIFKSEVERIFVSCVFTQNREKCLSWEGKAEIGGSGYDLKKTLPLEIEKVLPRINLGFTTRGCIRKCKFCIVPEKEGKIRVVGDLLDLWDGKSKNIIVLDNNILALHSHFDLICKQAHDNKIKVDFNQGLDHRLLTPEMVDSLKTVMHKDEYRFSFDSPASLPTVEKAIDLCLEKKLGRTFWYVLVGFDTTIEEDLARLNYLRKRGQTAYVQRYMGSKDPELLLLSNWANSHAVFKATTFEQFRKKFRKEKEKGKYIF